MNDAKQRPMGQHPSCTDHYVLKCASCLTVLDQCHCAMGRIHGDREIRWTARCDSCDPNRQRLDQERARFVPLTLEEKARIKSDLGDEPFACVSCGGDDEDCEDLELDKSRLCRECWSYTRIFSAFAQLFDDGYSPGEIVGLAGQVLHDVEVSGEALEDAGFVDRIRASANVITEVIRNSCKSFADVPNTEANRKSLEDAIVNGLRSALAELEQGDE